MKKLLSAVTSAAMTVSVMASAFASLPVSAAGSLSVSQPNFSMGEVLDVSANKTASDGSVEWLIPTVTAAPGQTVTIPVVAKNSSLAVAGAQFNVDAASPLKYKSVTGGDAYASNIGDNGKGTKFLFDDSNGIEKVAAEGATVFTLAYTIPEDCEEGTYAIKWANGNVSDTDGYDITSKVKFTDGAVKVVKDTGDGKIDWVLDTVTGYPGETVTVKAYVKNKDNASVAVAGAQYKIDVDAESKIKYKSFTTGGAYVKEISTNESKTSFLFGNTAGAGIVAGDNATIMTLTYTIPEDCKPGEYPVTWSKQFVSDTDGFDLTSRVNFVDGLIKVTSDVPSNGQVSWVLDNVKGEAGKSVTVKAVVNDPKSSALAVAGAQFKVKTDSTFTNSSFEAGKAYPSDMSNNDKTGKFMFRTSTGKAVSAANGSTILAITYDIPAGTPDGVYPVSWSEMFVSDADGYDLTNNVIFKDGSITIGDANTDGSVSWVIPNVTGEKGKDVTLNVKVQGKGDLPVAGAQFEIAGTTPPTYQSAVGKPYGEDLRTNDKQKFTFYTASGNGKTAKAGDDLFTLTFHVPEDCPDGVYPVTWAKQFVSDKDGFDITKNVKFVDGAIYINKEIPVEPTTTTVQSTTVTTTTTTVVPTPEGGIAWQIGSTQAEPGQTVTLDITVIDPSGSKLGVGGAQFIIENANGVNYKSVNENSAAYGDSKISSNDDVQKFLFASATGKNIVAANNSKVATLTFTVPADTKPGKYAVNFADGTLKVFDEDGYDLSKLVEGRNGYIEVVDHITTTLAPNPSTQSTTSTSTTAAPGESTTATPGGSTTATPGGSTTATPGGSTTATPGGSTTATPGGSTTATPGGSTTATPGGSTTATPGGSTTATPGGSTTATPGGSTTATPGGSTTATPGGSTTATPGGSTTATPGGSTTATPGGSTTATPGGSTTATPGGSTTATPGGSTTATPGGSTTATPGSTTTIEGTNPPTTSTGFTGPELTDPITTTVTTTAPYEVPKGSIAWVVEGGKAYPGEEVTVRVIVNDQKGVNLGIGGAQFKMDADGKVQLVKAGDKSSYGADIKMTDGTAKFLFTTGTGKAHVAADGSVVIELTYKIDADATPGSKIPVSIKDLFVSDEDGFDISDHVLTIPGNIEVLTPSVTTPDVSTTPVETTTVDVSTPVETTTVADTSVTPGVSTTATPGESTTATPGVSTTAAPGESTTATPGVSTTAAPGESTTATPGVSTTATPGESTTATPGVSTTATPGGSTTATPGVSTTATPGGSTTATPGVSTTATPGGSTTATPGETTTTVDSTTTVVNTSHLGEDVSSTTNPTSGGGIEVSNTTSTTSTTSVTSTGYKSSYATIKTQVGYYFSHDNGVRADGQKGGFNKDQVVKLEIIDVYEGGYEVPRAEINYDLVNFNGATPESEYNARTHVPKQTTIDDFKYDVPVYYGDMQLVDKDGKPLTVTAYIGVKGDATLDNMVDSVDASAVLRYYASISSNGRDVYDVKLQSTVAGLKVESPTDELDELAAFLADVNTNEWSADNWQTKKNGKLISDSNSYSTNMRRIDSNDASKILAYYARRSSSDYNDVSNYDIWNEVLGTARFGA
ncbi:cohesin domain-containing protein [Ruminococcus sp.]|uniref:cohesin domain-containing protein n=1 Tax=Ruminococcus sp. TaxID=41978 RepID=UPI0025D6A2E0|nr:cohesin domain-containing protein [Ruminococcus sp.]